MKIRTDFVTNSSSSGYVVITVVDANGKEENYQYDYDSGYGGYFWNIGINDGIDDVMSKVTTGSELVNILKNWFDEYVLESDESQRFIRNVLEMKSVRALFVEEETHMEGGGEESAELTCRFTTNDQNWDYCYKTKSINERGRVTASSEEGNPLLDIADETEPEVTGYEQYYDKNPEIEFEGKTFVFSGMGYWGSVPEDDPVVARVIRRGGILRQKVSGKTDYLVIGPELWGTSNLDAAIEQKKKGKDITIVAIKEFKKILEQTHFKKAASGGIVQHCDLFDKVSKIKICYHNRICRYGDFRSSIDGSDLDTLFSKNGWDLGWLDLAIENTERYKEKFDELYVVVGDLTVEQLDAGKLKKDYRLLERAKNKYKLQVFTESDLLSSGIKPYKPFPAVKLESIKGLNICCRGIFKHGYVFLNNCIKEHGGIPQKGNPTKMTDVFVVADKEFDECCVHSSNTADDIRKLWGYYLKNKKPLLFTESQFTSLGFFTKPGTKKNDHKE